MKVKSFITRINLNPYTNGGWTAFIEREYSTDSKSVAFGSTKSMLKYVSKLLSKSFKK